MVGRNHGPEELKHVARREEQLHRTAMFDLERENQWRQQQKVVPHAAKKIL
jgi:hypothetical protein